MLNCHLLTCHGRMTPKYIDLKSWHFVGEKRGEGKELATKQKKKLKLILPVNNGACR